MMNGKPFRLHRGFFMSIFNYIKTHIIVDKDELMNLKGQASAISRSQAVIEFDLKGNILWANDNFLNCLGYSLQEIQGRHHSIFVDEQYRNTIEYKRFWEKLSRGEFDAGQYRRITKSGKDVWIQASYNPIFDENKRPVKVVKYATDITEQKNKNADYEGQLAAIGKSQAVIEFDLSGYILHANENFLKTLGYSLEEIKGKHHSLFVDAAYRNSAEYHSFWERLGNGQYEAGRFNRMGKNEKSIWIQASYNPIFDLTGKPYKVVKYATDITDQVFAEQALQETVLQIQTVINASMANDLTLRIDTKNKTGSLLSLAEGVNALLDSMTTIVSEIKVAAEEIFTSASEISNGNTDLSSRTEQQAANLEETASSMEELTSTVKLNADNAKQANVLADKASSVATNGGALIQQVVQTMNDINQSSKKISDIIGVIDGIAFQTNILALNAAVEAARAGDQGRGFAVVASEVRTLAQRSANAAKDIKTLIGDSVQKIESGNLLVNKSGDTMNEIVNSIKRVNDIMSEIAAASNEQSSGIEEISTAVSQMDEMTQQNAALVEEAAAAAESLQSQADQMSRRVAKYKVQNEEARVVGQVAHSPQIAARQITSMQSARKFLPSR